MPVPVYSTKPFDRWARKAGLDDAVLCDVVDRVETGGADAALGGGVFKVRVAAPGRGKRGSYRTIVAFKIATLGVLVTGYAKADKKDLSADEQLIVRQLAERYFALDEPAMATLLQARELRKLR